MNAITKSDVYIDTQEKMAYHKQDILALAKKLEAGGEYDALAHINVQCQVIAMRCRHAQDRLLGH